MPWGTASARTSTRDMTCKEEENICISEFSSIWRGAFSFVALFSTLNVSDGQYSVCNMVLNNCLLCNMHLYLQNGAPS
jgi:hypothetical protein